MIRKVLVFSAFFMLCALPAKAQLEHVPVSHPVYKFLARAESRGFLPHLSLSELPWKRFRVAKALEMISSNPENLSSSERNTLELFEKEFGLRPHDNAVVLYSESDSLQVFSARMFGDYEKFIYHFEDSLHSVNLIPLASVEAMAENTEAGSTNVLLGNLGVRLHGTLSNMLGYYLQATNGAVISGERELALEDRRLRQNIKFADLNSDFDFSESHVHFQYNWFYATIGRETRLLGSGMNQRLYISTNSPPFDALSLGAEFSDFEYRYTHASLIGRPETNHDVGVETQIPDKYAGIHRFSYRPSWGEIAFWENIIYSDRNPDLAYLNPLSFFKSLEHALRDRDNSIMGLDAVIRPFPRIQIKGTFLLDDIIFSKLGTGYWSNKFAWNMAAVSALPWNIDLGVEYSRVEPFTFSHYNPQNSMTNDMLLYGSYIPANSDKLEIMGRWWFGGRYPLEMSLSYMRHGKNIYENDSLIFNAGSDPFITRSNLYPGEGSNVAEFLAGELQETFSLRVNAGIEIIRGFNLHGIYQLSNTNGKAVHLFRLSIGFEDF